MTLKDKIFFDVRECVPEFYRRQQCYLQETGSKFQGKWSQCTRKQKSKRKLLSYTRSSCSYAIASSMTSFEKVVFFCHQGRQSDWPMLPSRVPEHPSIPVLPYSIAGHADKGIEILPLFFVTDPCTFREPPIFKFAHMAWLL
jgi:hypothetical protein